ncbi:MAG TPA: DUF4838 domain-containing protein [Chthoniobacteraceae bacterium]|nr:DUF4838 domain-containing protein [Chthoniobacteraceae bacterium]
MKPTRTLLALTQAVFLTFTATSGFADEARLTLVENGQPRAALVADIPADATAPQAADIRKACGLMQMAVERATGVHLKLLTPEEAKAATPETALVLVGGGALGRATGIELRPLPTEGYRVVTQPDRCVVYGNSEEIAPVLNRYFEDSVPTCTFAAAEIVESAWKGHWLWPGPNGFFIPKTETVSLPVGDKEYRPRTASRFFSLPTRRTMGKDGKVDPKSVRIMIPEAEMKAALDWLRFHRFGRRHSDGRVHAFQDWWFKYHASHPDYFAQSPEGVRQPFPKEVGVKLRLGNPAVADRIMEEWREAGRPELYSISPNDGTGFDISPETLAMDEPAGQPVEAIWKGTANLSARYARFWEGLLQRMHKEKPDTRLRTLIYSAYRNPPPAGVKLNGLLGTFIHSWTEPAKESWAAWRTAGASLILRPNWGHLGAGAPYIHPHGIGEFIRWSAQNGCEGYSFDNLPGYWATQGINYYVMARLTQYPELTMDEVIGEYTVAFGKAKPLIREYLDYWEAYSKKCAYPVSAGGPFSIDPNGLYEQAVREKGLPTNALGGSHRALAYLYPDEIIAPARAILEKAANAVKEDDAEFRDRVRFLQLGLEHLVLNRDAVILGFAAGAHPTPEQRAAFRAKARELEAFRAKVTPLHVVWGEAAHYLEVKRASPAGRPDLAETPLNEDGL